MDINSNNRSWVLRDYTSMLIANLGGVVQGTFDVLFDEASVVLFGFTGCHVISQHAFGGGLE